MSSLWENTAYSGVVTPYKTGRQLLSQLHLYFIAVTNGINDNEIYTRILWWYIFIYIWYTCIQCYIHLIRFLGVNVIACRTSFSILTSPNQNVRQIRSFSGKWLLFLIFYYVGRDAQKPYPTHVLMQKSFVGYGDNTGNRA